jgi:membrane-bound lytic murein transglycosylase D
MRKIIAFVFVLGVINSINIVSAQRITGAEASLYVDFAPDEPDSIIAQRIATIDSDIDIVFNNKVRGFIDYFSIRNRDYTRKLLIRQTAYFPMFEKMLKKHNMPDALKYLTVVESAINPVAQSPVGALGLWQFMPATGKMYKLDYNNYMDERMDPEKSTEAACLYLKRLHAMFNDWEMALAAYNCGPGNVRRAIRRSGYKKTFWEVYSFLPRETRSYVPQFMAVNYVMRFAAEHNLQADYNDQLAASDTIIINQYTNLHGLSEHLGICHDDLVKMNPELLTNVVPESMSGYALKVPAHTAQYIRENRDSLNVLTSVKVTETQNYRKRRRTSSSSSTSGKERIVYRVKSGDVLGKIAERYHVRASDLRRWNRIGSSNVIRVGQKLSIYKSSSYFKKTSNSSVASTPKVIPANKTHTVRSGDTLWSISRQYNGLSIDKLKELNNLDGSGIKPGQKLKLG